METQGQELDEQTRIFLTKTRDVAVRNGNFEIYAQACRGLGEQPNERYRKEYARGVEELDNHLGAVKTFIDNLKQITNRGI